MPGDEVARDPVESQWIAQQLTPLYVLETTRFFLAWAAYESLEEIIAKSVSDSSHDNKKKLIMFLREHECAFPAKELSGTFRKVRSLLKQTFPIVVEKADKRATQHDIEQYAYIPLCREARNALVHAPGFGFSDVALEADWEDDIENHIEIVVWKEITRLMLLTMQSILFVYFRDVESTFDPHYMGCEDSDDVSVQEALCGLHLKQRF